MNSVVESLIDRALCYLDLWRLDRRHTNPPNEADAWTVFDLLICAEGLGRVAPSQLGDEGVATLSRLKEVVDVWGLHMLPHLMALPLPGGLPSLMQEWRERGADLPPDQQRECVIALLGDLDDLELFSVAIHRLDPDQGLAFDERLQGLCADIFESPWDWTHAEDWVQSYLDCYEPHTDPAIAATMHKFQRIMEETQVSKT